MSDARIGLYRDCAAAVAEDPESPVAQQLVTRWQTILDAECGHDAATVHLQIEAWRRRRQWAPGMVRYMASCYAMDADTWQKAADFLEAAYERSHP